MSTTVIHLLTQARFKLKNSISHSFSKKPPAVQLRLSSCSGYSRRSPQTFLALGVEPHSTFWLPQSRRCTLKFLITGLGDLTPTQYSKLDNHDSTLHGGSCYVYESRHGHPRQPCLLLSQHLIWCEFSLISSLPLNTE